MNRRQLYSYIQEVIDDELVYILSALNERTNSSISNYIMHLLIYQFRDSIANKIMELILDLDIKDLQKMWEEWWKWVVLFVQKIII